MNEQDISPEILEVLRSMDLFKGKDSEELSEWLGKAPFEGGAECVLKQYPRQFKILDEGTFGNAFYLLIRGAVAATIGPEAREVAQLQGGSFFGEGTLISGQPHTVTYWAREPCTVIEVPRRAFELYMRKPGPFRNVMDQSYTERSLASHLRLFLDSPKIDAKMLASLVQRVKLRIFARDEAIIREGQEADSFYLIRDGHVRVVKKMSGGDQRTVAYLNDGGYFGESSVLNGGRRDFSVFAMGKVEVVQVMRNDLIALVNLDDSLADRFQEKSKIQPGEGAFREGFVNEVVERGVVKATSALVIHLDTCTRCGNCVKACAELHDGISRLTRRGMFFEAPAEENQKPEPLLVTTSCMHCLDPECMIGCPTGAITRDVNGEVVILDSCIGCTNCARRCPYGNISMAEIPEKEIADSAYQAPLIGGYLKLWRKPGTEPVSPAAEKPTQKAVVRRVAVKCDLCQAYNYNHGCVHNCPYGAIERMGNFLNVRGSE